jgi:hypothetical protein
MSMTAMFETLSRFGYMAAAVLIVMTVSVLPASADPGNGNGWGQGNGGGKNHGGPGPVIGEGLPALLLIGGGVYLFLRRARRKSA